MDFEELRKNFNQALVLALLKLKQPFEVEIDVSGYTMREVLMQGGSPKCYLLDLLLY